MYNNLEGKNNNTLQKVGEGGGMVNVRRGK